MIDPKELGTLSIEEKRELLARLLREKAEPSATVEMSFAQQRLWLLDRLDPGEGLYNVPLALRISGELDVQTLEKAMGAVIARHESLRTTFAESEGRLVQVIEAAGPTRIAVIDLDRFPLEERRAEAERLAVAEARRPFDLQRGPLCRALLMRLASDDHVLVLTIHHIVSDGWSLSVFLQELAAFYESSLAGGESPFPELPIQYGDFAQWQRELMVGEALQRQLAYWRDRLTPLPAVLELPADRPRPATPTHRGARERVNWERDFAERVRAFSRREGATLFMTLMAAFQALLHRYSGQSDIAVGTAIAGRNRAELEGLIGCFINTLVSRGDAAGDPSFRDFLWRTREAALGAYAHQDLPFEMLVEALRPDRTLSDTPLFQVMLVLQNAPRPVLELPGLTLRPLEIDIGIAKFDLTLELTEVEEGLRAELEYSTDLFDQERVRRMFGHFRRLLEGAIAAPEQRLSRLPLLTDEERQQLLVEWNAVDREGRQELSLSELFERQVERTPQALAVVCGQGELSYAEVNRRANRLAHRLMSLGVGPEVCVGLYLERSVEMVVAVIGVLKAGGAYVPLDLAYPAERVAFMLEEAEAPLLITQDSLLERLPALSARILRLDAEAEAIEANSAENPVERVAANNAAYVIYTSGSTGKPKGVVVCHGEVARLFKETEGWFGFGEQDVWTLFHSYAFDFSVWEMWGALLYGGRLVVVPYWVSRSPEDFLELLAEQKVTVLNQTPSAFRQLISEEAKREARPLALRIIIFGGEALELQSLRPWMERHGDERPRLVNMYGITETTVHVTYRPLARGDLEGSAGSLIGRPIPDMQVYLLDRHLQPVPIGVPGEMYVGGGGLTRGYLRRPELTAERFIPNALGARPGGRLYRTGDLAQYRGEGELEYLGRLDHQVKIRGFRIELGEIEAALREHPGVEEAVVVAREDTPGGKRFVAYVVPDHKSAYTVRQLLRLEREGLPPGQSRYELPNGMVIVHQNKSETEFAYQEIFGAKSYLRHGIALHEGDCIFDVGAHIGFFTLFVGQTRKNLRIFAFEPIPPLFQLLRTNAALYDLDVRLFNCGISNEQGTAAFTYYPHVSLVSGRFADPQEEKETIRAFLRKQLQTSPGDSSLSDRSLDEMLQARLATERFTCPLQTISDVIRENGVERIDLLKIDVEKSEWDVLEGIREDDWPKIRQIVVEVHDIEGRLEQIKGLLQRRGFGVTVEQENLLEDTGLYNVYAVRTPTEHDAAAGAGEAPAFESAPAWSSPDLLRGDLRRLLKEKLPEYMVPSAFVLLEALPLTQNGKVDRRALPEPEAARRGSEATFLAPRSPAEELIAGIFASVLGLERVGAKDNFFELGGHSLLATQVVSRIRETFRIELPLRRLFESATPAELAPQVEAFLKAPGTTLPRPISRAPRDRELPLSFSQQRLWFLHQWQPEDSSYSVPLAIRLTGALDVEALQNSLNAIVTRHEALRTTFAARDGVPQQVIAETASLPLELLDEGESSPSEWDTRVADLAVAEAVRPFDLERGPLVRARLVRLDKEEHALLLTMHHIVTDGWSLNVLFRELATLYDALSRKQPVDLPDLPIQYVDYAVWERDRLRGPVLDELLRYWRQQLAGSPALNLPMARRGEETPSSRGALRAIRLSKDLSNSLAALSQGEGVTLFMTLLAALQSLLGYTTSEDDVVVGTDVANRNRVETEGLIGCFVNHVVMRVGLSGNPTFRELLQRVRETALGAYAHQELPFDKLVEHLRPPRIRGRTPLFQILFVLQNLPGQQLELGGIRLRFLDVPVGTAKFDLALFLNESEKGLWGHWVYKTDLFSPESLARLSKEYEALLRRVVEQPDSRLMALHRQDESPHGTGMPARLRSARPRPVDLRK